MRWQPYSPGSVASTSRFPAPYLSTPIFAISTSLPHSTHPTTRHTHLPLDVIQHKPCQTVCPVGKPHAISNLSSTRGPDEIMPSCTDHTVRSSSKIWQDNYLSVYMTANVPPELLKTCRSWEDGHRAWDLRPNIVRRDSTPLSKNPHILIHCNLSEIASTLIPPLKTPG